MRIILIALLLTGCTTTRYHTTSCLTAEQYKALADAEPEKVGNKLTGNAEQDIKPIAGSAVRLRAWGNGLLTVLGGCVTPPDHA